MGETFRYEQLFIPAVLLCAFAAAGIYAIGRRPEKGWIFETLSGIAAAAVGIFFGLMAHPLYTSRGEIRIFGNGVEIPYWTGPVAAGVVGLLAGVWFVKHLRELLAGGFEGGHFVGQGVWVGLLLGVVCSTLMHIVLMTGYLNSDLRPLLIGAGFGAVSGLFLGPVIAAVFWYAHKAGAIKIEEQA